MPKNKGGNEKGNDTAKGGQLQDKNKQGFIQSEVKTLLKSYPGINMDKFNDSLMGIPCMMVDGEMVIYHCDIEKAIRCGVENKDLYINEWD